MLATFYIVSQEVVIQLQACMHISKVVHLRLVCFSMCMLYVFTSVTQSYQNCVKNETTQLIRRRTAFSGTETLEKFPEPPERDTV